MAESEPIDPALITSAHAAYRTGLWWKPIRTHAANWNSRRMRLTVARSSCGLPRRHLADNGLLDVGIRTLVRVQFPCVGGQVKNIDLRLVRGEPSAHPGRRVYPQPVQDQEHLALGVTDQALPSPRHRESSSAPRRDGSPP